MSTFPLVFSNGLLGFTNHYLTYGLFFVAGWFDLLGGMLPAYQVLLSYFSQLLLTLSLVH